MITTLRRPKETQLILASTSPFRRELLERLGIKFECVPPDIDETPLENESARDLAERLALMKATHVATTHPVAVVIGSDQCATINGEIIGKPGNHENAVKQLKNASGQHLRFHTGIAVVSLCDNKIRRDVIDYDVYFRELGDEEIENYLRREQPYQCTGAFKSEALGITLVEKFAGDDPSALIGLPLIRLCALLHEIGLDVLKTNRAEA